MQSAKRTNELLGYRIPERTSAQNPIPSEIKVLSSSSTQALAKRLGVGPPLLITMLLQTTSSHSRNRVNFDQALRAEIAKLACSVYRPLLRTFSYPLGIRQRLAWAANSCDATGSLPRLFLHTVCTTAILDRNLKRTEIRGEIDLLLIQNNNPSCKRR